MDVHTNIPLKNYTTMHLGGNAHFMADITTPEDAAVLYKNAKERSLPTFILGGGSNTIVRDEGFAGVVLRMRIPGFEVLQDTLNDTTIKIGAGEIWDDVVRRTVEMKLSGIEAMSAIPGTAGAAPVQNVGAYGQEIADTLVELAAYDTETDTFVTIPHEDCRFSYRNSIFRDDWKGRYIITSITLKLSKTPLQPPFYAALEAYFEKNNVTYFTGDVIRGAVMAIRKDKLPDPAELPNSGSFFKNAIIEKWQLDELQQAYPDMPSYDMGGGLYKVPTGWLIDTAGLKGKLFYGIRVYEKNALVLVNESAASYADLAKAREEIAGTIRDTFRILIEQEPLEMTA